jgi:SAM-dependent methyltransferase
MVDIARKRNRRQVKAGRVKVVVAGADRLPFTGGAFDKALCVHVVYFWPDLDRPLKEIARVLKPGGRLALLFRTSADEAAVQAFPPDIYRFPALKDMTVALAAAGFSIDATATIGDPGAGPVLLVAERLGAPG